MEGIIIVWIVCAILAYRLIENASNDDGNVDG